MTGITGLTGGIPVASTRVDLTVRTSVVGGFSVLGASGEIDLGTLPDLHNALVRWANEHRGETVIIDLDGVNACDDAGLGIVLGCAGRVRESGGELVVVCSEGSFRRRLARTGFDRAIAVEPTIAEATSRQRVKGATPAPGLPSHRCDR